MNSKRETSRVGDSDDGGRVHAAAVCDDVWTEIWAWLPAKSAIGLILVSKRWLSLISGDEFRRLHTLRHKSQPFLLLRTRTSRFFYFNPFINGENPKLIPYKFALPEPKILSSCNGLLLLQSDNPQTNYYAYNPTTKESRGIALPYDADYPSIMGLSLAFDPSESPHYKIVCVRGGRKSPFVCVKGGRKSPRSDDEGKQRSYRIEVFDSGIPTSWQLCPKTFTDSTDINLSPGVYCNKSIYWKKPGALLHYDIGKNDIRSLSCEFPTASQLQESNGHLYLFAADSEGESITLWKFQGGDDSELWALKCYDSPPRPLGGRLNTIPLRFICGSDGEEETTGFLVTHSPGRIGAYSFRDRSFEELVDLTDQPFYHQNTLQFDSQNVHQFGESLAVVSSD